MLACAPIIAGWQLLANQVISNPSSADRMDCSASSPATPRIDAMQGVQVQMPGSGNYSYMEVSDGSDSGLSCQACVTPRPHQWLYKEYKLFEELGSGGFGVVKK